MPIYEYQCENCGVMEISHGMAEEAVTVCPKCNSDGLQRLFSSCVGIIMGGKQMNQYSDVKCAKYWRDSDGNRHRVTASDGDSKSPTVSSKRKRTDEQARQKIRRERKQAKRQRQEAAYRDYCRRMEHAKKDPHFVKTAEKVKKSREFKNEQA